MEGRAEKGYRGGGGWKGERERRKGDRRRGGGCRERGSGKENEENGRRVKRMIRGKEGEGNEYGNENE